MTLPIVCGVWLLALAVAVYTCAVLPWFLDYYDYFQGQSRGSIEYGLTTRAFHAAYPLGIPLGLTVLGYGVQLLKPPECRVAHVLWYAAITIGMAVGWFVWTLLSAHDLNVLMFPA